MDPVRPLLELVGALRRADSLEAMLNDVVASAASILGVERVSVRLFDESRAQLLVAARTGTAVHDEARFAPGEGLVGWVAAQETALRVGSAERDPRFVAREGARVAMRSFLGAPLLEAEGCIGVLAAVDEREDRFDDRDLDLLSLVAAVAAPHLQVARIRRLAELDPLTSVLNRRGLEASVSMLQPFGESPVAVAIADIDHFKLVNDTRGHEAGDRVLTAVAQTLANQLRRGDLIARFGGEEFVLVLRGVRLATGARVAERARAAIEATRFAAGPGDPVTLTISIGVAESQPGEAWDALLRRADSALYRAKGAGRNRVVTDGTPRASDPGLDALVH